MLFAPSRFRWDSDSSKRFIPCGRVGCACRCCDFVPDVVSFRSQSMPAFAIVASASMWHPVRAWPANWILTSRSLATWKRARLVLPAWSPMTLHLCLPIHALLGPQGPQGPLRALETETETLRTLTEVLTDQTTKVQMIQSIAIRPTALWVQTGQMGRVPQWFLLRRMNPMCLHLPSTCLWATFQSRRMLTR